MLQTEAVQTLKLKDIQIDPRLQMRAQTDYQAVAEYAECLDELPPAKVCLDDDGRYWLWDGNHTFLAYQKAHRNEMPCDVSNGTFLDAMRLAAGANGDQSSLRRTNEDKRIAVTRLLLEPEFADWSDRYMADCSNTSHTFVARIRDEIEKQRLKDQADKAAREAKNKPPQGDQPQLATVPADAKPKTRKGKDGKNRKEPYRVLDGLIVCVRCHRIGKPIPKCPACENARETAAKKANSKPKAKTSAKPPQTLTWDKIDEQLVKIAGFLLALADVPGRSLSIDRCNQLRKAIKDMAD